jgi:3-hydroxybutyryl-CoA dehydrogenase
MIMSDIATESGSAAGGIDQIRHIVIVGAGAMGSQIGMLCALAGFEATITDLQGDALDRADHELRQRLTRDIEKGRRTQDEVDVAFGRLEFSTDLTTAATTADYVIEAAVEKLDVKRQLFADLDRLAHHLRSWPPTPPASSRPVSRTPPADRTGSATCTSSTRRW